MSHVISVDELKSWSTFCIFKCCWHPLCVNHERLTHRFQGRDDRLTDVRGGLINAILINATAGRSRFFEPSDSSLVIAVRRSWHLQELASTLARMHRGVDGWRIHARNNP